MKFSLIQLMVFTAAVGMIAASVGSFVRHVESGVFNQQKTFGQVKQERQYEKYLRDKAQRDDHP